MTITIYHNPDCGTSRNVLAMIRNSGEEPRIIEYLKTPPSRDELVDLLRRMGMRPRELLRRKGTPYDELGLDDAKWTDEQLIDLMLRAPDPDEPPDRGHRARCQALPPLRDGARNCAEPAEAAIRQRGRDAGHLTSGGGTKHGRQGLQRAFPVHRQLGAQHHGRVRDQPLGPGQVQGLLAPAATRRARSIRWRSPAASG